MSRRKDEATPDLFPPGDMPAWCKSGSIAEPEDFGGPDVRPKDAKRFAGQLGLVARLMADGRWRTLAAIAKAVQGTEAGVSARLRDLRKARWGSRLVERRRCLRPGQSARFEYRVHPEVSL